jgi:hypothetical protein
LRVERIRMQAQPAIAGRPEVERGSCIARPISASRWRASEIEITLASIMGGNDVQVDESAVVPRAPVVNLRTYSLMDGNTCAIPGSG